MTDRGPSRQSVVMTDSMEMGSKDQGLPSLGQRSMAAMWPLLGGVFLGGITWAVPTAEIEGPAILGLLIRVFFAAVVGGIALFCFFSAGRSLLGHDVRQRATDLTIPEVLLGLCPGCGAPLGTSDLQSGGADRSASPSTLAAPITCPLCDHPLRDRAARWKRQESSAAANVFLLILGAGLLSLGLFLTLGPWLEEGSRGWAVLIAMTGLGLLVGSVGGLMLWGGLLVSLEDMRRLTRFSYHHQYLDGLLGGACDATATTIGDKLVFANGSTRTDLSMAIVAPKDHASLDALTETQRAYALALDELYHRGLAHLWVERLGQWTLGSALAERRLFTSPAAPSLSSSRQEQILASFSERLADGQIRPLYEMFASRCPKAIAVGDLWRTFRDEPGAMDGIGALLDDLRRDAAGDDEHPRTVATVVAQVIRPQLLN